MEPSYAVIETDAGLRVVQLESAGRPEVAAEKHGGVIVDPGPYKSFDEAYDAMLALQDEEEEQQDGA